MLSCADRRNNSTTGPHYSLYMYHSPPRMCHHRCTSWQLPRSYWWQLLLPGCRQLPAAVIQRHSSHTAAYTAAALHPSHITLNILLHFLRPETATADAWALATPPPNDCARAVAVAVLLLKAGPGPPKPPHGPSQGPGPSYGPGPPP